MKYNQIYNIITDNDVTITDGTHIGESLNHVLSELDKDIQDLKSNVKWIYKYGGVGSGNGGGGGGDKDPMVTATINGVSLTSSGSTVVLSGPGQYTLNVGMRYPLEHSFRVTIEYPTRTGTTKNVISLPTALGEYLTTTTLPLVANGNISITAIDNTTSSPTDTILTYAVVNPYTLLYNIVGEDSSALLSQSGEAFINVVNNSGMFYRTTYDIAINADVSYTCYLNGAVIGSGTLADKKGVLNIPIFSKNYFTSMSASEKEAHSGLYTAKIKFIILPQAEGSNLIELENEVTFTLLPSDFYIACIPSKGQIYNSVIDEDYYSFQLSTQLTVKAYEGIQNFDRLYQVYYKYVPLLEYLDNPTVSPQDDIPISITERSDVNKLTLTCVDSGWYALALYCPLKNYNKVYYMNFSAFLELDYYLSDRIGKESSIYFHAPYTDGSSTFADYHNKAKIELNYNGKTKIFSNLLNNGTAYTGTHIALGILLSSINNFDNPLFKINTVNSSYPIYIYLDKILFGEISTSSNTKTIFIPTTEVLSSLSPYHLLSIYSRLKSKVGTNYYYEVVIYIDGVPEAALTLYNSTALMPTSIEMNPANYYLNNVEVTYIYLQKDLDSIEYPYSDLDETLYNLAYKLNVNLENIGDLYSILQTFIAGLHLDEKEWIEVTDEFVTKTKEISGVPTLTLEYYPKNDTSSGIGGDIRSYVDASYDEDQGDSIIPVQIEYCNANSTSVSYYSGTDATFWIKLQGSSTKKFKSKNFTLGIGDKDGLEGGGQTVRMFTPNFNSADSSSFLPELKFILKADIVDSSHSNNVAVGKFVNANTTRFFNANEGNYKYVKNCLDGFPINLFLKIYEGEQNTSPYKEYYIGIYNFNLGRDSYSNLGYYTTSTLNSIVNKIDPHKNGNFLTLSFSIEDLILELRSELTVAEISDGSPYHDFSQFDSTILFDSEGMTGMFGDIVPSSNTFMTLNQQRISTFVLKVAKAGGWLFHYLGKNFGDLTDGYSKSVTSSALDFNSKNLVPDCLILYRKSLQGSTIVYTPYTSNSIQRDDIESALATPVYALLDNMVEDAPNNCRLDLQSAVEYYTVCMAFALVDSVQKNLNIKTFDGGLTFRIAFYDMDTCLGIDNNASQTTWFAFSDYWTEGPNKEVIIYPDYYPKRTADNMQLLDIGFDIPSSYLFAVSKYSSYVSNEYVKPQDLWGSWRQLSGCLKNASYFVDNYFAKSLANVPNALFSLNYRFKYLRSASSTSLIDDSSKLLGRGIERVRSWLNGRLHLLDAYFNLNTTLAKISYRDKLNLWVDYPQTRYELRPEDQYVPKDNPDVYVTSSIFNDGVDLKIDLNGTVTFKAKEYSPVIIGGDKESVRFLIKNPDDIYSYTKASVGSQTFKTLGSLNFTYLTNCGFFASSESHILKINSNTLQYLLGNLGVISEFELHCPSLQTLNLNCLGSSASFSGLLLFIKTDDNDPNPNLLSIDISGTKINLNITRESVKEVHIDSLNSRYVSLIDCDNLETVTLSNVTLTDYLNISPVWSDEIKINNIRVPKITLGGTRGIIELTNSTPSLVTMSNFREIKISNCTNIETLEIPSGKTSQYEDCLEKLTINNASKLTELDLTSHDNLQYLNVQGCSSLSTLKLHKNALTRLTYLNLSSTMISEIIWVDDEGNESGEGWIDLTDAISLTSSTSEFICENNTLVRFVKLPNTRSSEEKWLKDNIENAVYVGSFKGCSSLERVYGNFIVKSEYSFLNCSRFSIFGKNPIYNSHEIDLYGAVRMPYLLNDASQLTGVLPKSLYFEIPDKDSYSMDVVFNEDIEKGGVTLYATNMSFDVTNLSQMFEGTDCSLFDIYYFFSNCMPIKKNAAFGLKMVGTFGNLTSIVKGTLDSYLLHNTTSIQQFDPFNGTTKFENPLVLKSPTMEDGKVKYNDGFYSPLFKTCTTLSKSRTSSSGYWNVCIIDNNFFRGDFGDLECALQTITNLLGVIVSNRDSWGNVNTVTSYDAGQSYDESDGNFTDMFVLCNNLQTITKAFATTLFIDFDTLKLPDSVTTIAEAFASNYGKGKICLCESAKEGDSFIFSKNNNLVAIEAGSFIVNNRFNASGTVLLATYHINNNTLKDFLLLEKLGSQGSNGSMPTYLSGNGIAKIIDLDNFPYDLLLNCPNITRFIGFFNGCSTLNELEAPLRLPGDLFKYSTLLEDASYTLYGLSGIDIELTSNGFLNCPKLTSVLGFAENARIQGHIPPYLFKNNTGTLLDMSYVFTGVTSMSPYNNPSATAEAEYDGVNNKVSEDTGAGVSSIAAPYREAVINEYGTFDYFNIDGALDGIENYAFAPDLFWYCGNSNVNIQHAFDRCSSRKDGVPLFAGTNSNAKGLRGRIPPCIFRGVTNILNMDYMFSNCNLLNGSMVDGRAYVVPKGFFRGLQNKGTALYTFANMVFPLSLSLKNVFDGILNNCNLTGLFYHCYFDSNEEPCHLDDFTITAAGLILKFMFAFNNSGSIFTPGVYDINDQSISFGNFLTYKTEKYSDLEKIFVNYKDDEKTILFNPNIITLIPKDDPANGISIGAYYNSDHRIYKTINEIL